MGWIADYPSMDNFLYPLFQSSQARTGSYTFYSNKQVDDLLQQARSTVDATAAARTCTRRRRRSSSRTCPPSRCTSTATSASPTTASAASYHNPMGFTDMWTLWVK